MNRSEWCWLEARPQIIGLEVGEQDRGEGGLLPYHSKFSRALQVWFLTSLFNFLSLLDNIANR